MPAERKAKWRKEIDWLLSVTDYIVEMVPSQQKSKDGSSMEVQNPLPLSISFLLSSIFTNKIIYFDWSIDNDHTTKNRSTYEHPCLAQARYNAYCKNYPYLTTLLAHEYDGVFLA